MAIHCRHIPVITRICLAALLLAACSESGETAPEGVQGADRRSRLDSCRLLAAANPAAILGMATDDGHKLWETDGSDPFVSQCTFTAANDPARTLGLLVRYASDSTTPAGRRAYIDDVRSGDAMGAGEETAQALEAGRQIADLGDLALTYELFTYNVMVWNGDYQFTVMLGGFSGDEAERLVVAVARTVLSQL